MMRELGNRNHEAETLKALAELHYKIGQPAQALEYCEQAVAITTELDIPLVNECEELQLKISK